MGNRKTPWHIWVVGVLSLLWNAGGAMDFTMSNFFAADYMAAFTEQKRAFFTGFPAWVTLSWGIATWGAILGSVLILLRNKLAVPVFLIALLGLIVTSLHNFYLSDIKMFEIAGVAAMWFTAVIFIVSVLLLVYCRKQAKNGNLR